MSKNTRNASPAQPRPDKATGPIIRLAYSMEEAATSLGISRTAMFALARARQIQVVKIGRRTLVPVSQVEALMARLQ